MPKSRTRLMLIVLAACLVIAGSANLFSTVHFDCNMIGCPTNHGCFADIVVYENCWARCITGQTEIVIYCVIEP